MQARATQPTGGAIVPNDQQAYGSQQTYSNQQAYGSQQTYSNQQAYDSQQAYSNQRAYDDQQAYSGQQVYQQAQRRQFGAAAPATGTIAGFGTMQIAAMACGLATIVLMFLKWLSVPLMQQLSSYASILGIESSSDYKYSMLGMGDVTDVLDTLYSWSGSSGNSPFGAIRVIFLILWIIALALIVIGIVMMAVGSGHPSKLLFIGGIVAAVVAIAWCLAISAFNGAIESELSSELGASTTIFKVTAAPIIAAIGGIATAACAKLAR